MQVFGLIGNPVGHSLSPPMHEAAYEALEMDARYVTFEPAPEALSAAVEGAAALGVAGLNVTIPFKRDALDHPRVEPDGLAARVGAVNTLAFPGDGDGDRIRGYNTDAAGARRALEGAGVDLDGCDATVVGAGGAGRAVAFALADAGASVHVANRTAERATELAAALPGEADGGGLDSMAEAVPASDVLVNATSVGMEEDETPVPGELLHEGATVLDAVYAPLDTRLLREARAAGATTVDGARMLLYQGVEAFERWTGTAAPVDEMDAALRSRL